MRKTIMLGTLIALFGATALAQARDVTAPEQSSPAEASQPDTSTLQAGQGKPERLSASREHRHENRDGRRERHDEAAERDNESGKHSPHH